MKYTEKGNLIVGLDELERMLEYAKNRAKHGSMLDCIEITRETKPRILQRCGYAECNPIDHTYGVH